jgi:hypothetical protein
MRTICEALPDATKTVTFGHPTFQVMPSERFTSYRHFGPTELRILLIVGNLFALRRPYATIAGRDFLLFDIGFTVGTVALALILVHATIRHTVSLYREETRR